MKSQAGQMKIRKRVASIIVLMVSGTVANAVLFQDTFDTADSTDVNANYPSRQSGGSLTSGYTATSTYFGISDNKLAQTGGGALTLSANLAGDLVGNDFEISCKLTINSSDSKWTALYLMSANENTRGSSRLGLHAYDSGNGTAYTVYYGTGDSQLTKGVTTATMTTKLGRTFDKTEEHTLQFISTAETGTCDFVVDGVTILSNLAYAFSEDSTRKIGITATLVNDGAGATYDDLTVIPVIPVVPEPATLGIFAFAAPR
jgi:hypothetical protein